MITLTLKKCCKAVQANAKGKYGLFWFIDLWAKNHYNDNAEYHKSEEEQYAIYIFSYCSLGEESYHSLSQKDKDTLHANLTRIKNSKYGIPKQ